MPASLISDIEVKRYRALMAALESDSGGVAKVAAARMGISGDQFSNFRGARKPGLAQLWLNFHPAKCYPKRNKRRQMSVGTNWGQCFGTIQL